MQNLRGRLPGQLVTFIGKRVLQNWSLKGVSTGSNFAPQDYIPTALRLDLAVQV